MSFQNILVAVDGSPASHSAVQLAAEMAGAFAARLTIAHVVQIPTPLTPEVIGVCMMANDVVCEAGRRVLADALAQLPDPSIAKILLYQGAAAAKILQAAYECRADLIILGTRGRGRLAHFVMGSTTEEVIHRASCPVLINPDPGLDCADRHYHLEAYAQ